MSNQPSPAEPIYRVVVNHEGQYSIWPSERDAPAGWSDGGKVGPREECLAFVEQAWVDMRPASLRGAKAEGV